MQLAKLLLTLTPGKRRPIARTRRGLSTTHKHTMNINTILRNSPRNSMYGAPMGKMDREGEDMRVYLQRVQFVDGDYAPDGTYWGYTPKEHLYCGMSKSRDTEVYIRAGSRAAAKQRLAEQGFTFYH